MGIPAFFGVDFVKRFFAFLLILAVIAIMAPFGAAAEDNEVCVVIDGKEYSAHIGDVVSYCYLLDIGGIDARKGSLSGMVTEVEGAVTYNTDSLRLVTALEEDEDGNYPAFPALVKGNLTVNTRENRIKYNAVRLKGYSFGEKTALVRLDFEVIGKDAASIGNHIRNLGSGEVKLIYLDEELVAPKTSSEAEIYCIGDVDTDGAITIIDATYIQMFVAEMKELSSVQRLLAEFNGDREIVIDDATCIQRMIADLDYTTYR